MFLQIAFMSKSLLESESISDALNRGGFGNFGGLSGIILNFRTGLREISRMSIFRLYHVVKWYRANSKPDVVTIKISDMVLPKCIEELIRDYYWSHRMFEVKQRLHRDFFHMQLQNELYVFWNAMPHHLATMLVGPYAL